MSTVISISVIFLLVFEIMLGQWAARANDSKQEKHQHFADRKKSKRAGLQQDYANTSLLDSKRFTHFTPSHLLPQFSTHAYTDLVLPTADLLDVETLTYPEKAKAPKTKRKTDNVPQKLNKRNSPSSSSQSKSLDFIFKTKDDDYQNAKAIINQTAGQLKKVLSVVLTRSIELMYLGIFAFKRLRHKLDKPSDELLEYAMHLASQITSTAIKDAGTAKKFAKRQVKKINAYLSIFLKEIHTLAQTFSKRVKNYLIFSDIPDLHNLKEGSALLTYLVTVKSREVQHLSQIAIKRIEKVFNAIMDTVKKFVLDVYNNITVLEEQSVFEMQELGRIFFKKLHDLGNSKLCGKTFHKKCVSVKKEIQKTAPEYYMEIMEFFNKEVKKVSHFCVTKVKKMRKDYSTEIDNIFKL